MAEPVDFGIYVPQMAFQYEDILQRARLCEELGFSSFWLFDHLYGPQFPELPALEGWTLATALLTQTTTLRVGHLVLCNNFRHPALLGRMATTLDLISGGRLEFGLGSGSVEEEHHQAGLPWGSLAERSERLGEGLEIVTRMFASEKTTFAGRHYQVRDVPNVPLPVQRPRPPIHVGGAHPKHTLPLVARYADVWNVPVYALGDWQRRVGLLEAECERIGRDPSSIRRSHEAVLVLAPDDRSLAEARAKAERRFGGPTWGLEEGGYIGTPSVVSDRIAELIEQGISMFVFFTFDRGGEATLRLFAEEVMPHFSR